MIKNVPRTLAVLIGALSIVLLSACATSNLESTASASEASTQTQSSLERIRYSQLSAWDLMEDESLWIELNNPIRTYRLELRPSCLFALRQAIGLQFSGMSPNFIALGDEVVVGSTRCEIVGIYETGQHRGARASAQKKLN
ncbi:MAG TPA: DUF6491 family protein [Wenzhouxiangella sp.]